MSKKHLKRLNAPRSWRIKRKGITFVTRTAPGPHKIGTSMPLNVILRDLLKYANTTREVRIILQNKNVLVNGVRRKDIKFPVGLFDVMEIRETKEYFRVILDEKGKINLIKTDKSDAEVRPCKIKGKTKVRGKVQLNLFDGSNILVGKDDYKTVDTLLVGIPKKDIKKRIKFEKKALIYLIGGKHIAEIGTIEDIKQNKVMCRIGSSVFETSKDYAFVIGEDKPSIKVKNEPDEKH